MSLLSDLTDRFEALTARGKIHPIGWGAMNVHYMIDLTLDGKIKELIPLRTSAPSKNARDIDYQSLSVPHREGRTSGVKAYFLADNVEYMLGLQLTDDERQMELVRKRFETAKVLHEDVLAGVEDEAAQAVRAYFARGANEKQEEHPILGDDSVELSSNTILIFSYERRPLNEVPAVRSAWNRHYELRQGDGEEGVCLVTGKLGPIAKIHPPIKGLKGAKAQAAIVSFNATAYESYGNEKGANAPVSNYAAVAYTTALNHLLKDRMHHAILGEMTLVYWSYDSDDGADELAGSLGIGYSDASQDVIENQIDTIASALESGKPIDVDGKNVDLGLPFILLGLEENTARVSVTYYQKQSFGYLLRNLLEHHRRCEIVRCSSDSCTQLTFHGILCETVNDKAKNPKVRKNLARQLVQAVLSNQRYPRGLYVDLQKKIRSEGGKITGDRAAIIKGYLMKNLPENHQAQEVLTVKLNSQSHYPPYVLGRIFAVLEAIQDGTRPQPRDSIANKGAGDEATSGNRLNSTIKDRYFNSVSTMPATTLPYLMRLSQAHLKKLEIGTRIWFEMKLQDLLGMLDEPFPKVLNLEDQGIFQLGYYHECRVRFLPKDERKDELNQEKEQVNV